MSHFSIAEQSKWRNTAVLDVRLLGTVDFDAAQFLQERLVYEISGRDDRFGGLLLCEHPPLITVGRPVAAATSWSSPKSSWLTAGCPLAQSGGWLPGSRSRTTGRLSGRSAHTVGPGFARLSRALDRQRT